MTRVKECVLYRGFEHGDILDKMTALMDASERSAVNASEMEEEFYECVNGLIEIAGSYGFTGNLWHDYLTLLLVNHENAFSMASEIRGAIEGSINQLALHDFAILKNCMILTRQYWINYSILPAAAFSVIMRHRRIREKCSTNVSVTESVI